jgi:hypothetical protein
VEAFFWRGCPSYFAVLDSDGRPDRARLADSKKRRESVVRSTRRLVFLCIMVIAIPWAWSNYKAGRSDRRGAMRLVTFMLAIRVAVWLLRARHTPEFSVELLHVCIACLQALGVASALGIFYIALEPYARRHWPHMLITWSRISSLRLGDPAVGQHVVIGACIGCIWAVLMTGERVLVNSLGWVARQPLFSEDIAEQLLGGRLAVAGHLDALSYAILKGLLLLSLLAVLRALLRRPLLAAVLAGVIIAPMVVPRGGHILTSWLVFGIGGVAVAVWAMIRYGLVTLTVAIFVSLVLNTSPIVFDPSLWYADSTFYALTIVLSISIYGFVISRSGPITD